MSLLGWLLCVFLTTLPWMGVLYLAIAAYELTFNWREYAGDGGYTQQDIERLRFEANWNQYMLDRETKDG